MCIGALRIVDVRALMPNYEAYKDWQRGDEITGVAIHHSATAEPKTGAPVGDARTFFEYHVDTRGWTHGAYHYVVLPDGTVEYALDEKVAGYHAGFRDPGNAHNLEHGQYWNNHYLAICLVGYFEMGRIHGGRPIPEAHTTPTAEQMTALRRLTRHLMQKHGFAVKDVRGHRELAGCNTHCPGLNFDLDALRAMLEDGDDEGGDCRYDCCTECVERFQRRDIRRRGDVLPE